MDHAGRRSDRHVDRRALLVSVVAAAGALGRATPVSAQPTSGAAPVAETVYGRVRGYHDGRAKVFRGVPYGAPTGGAGRWRPAAPPAPWAGVLDATTAGPMCPQTRLAPLAEEMAMSQTSPVSEDCLRLNITTPEIGPASGRRPVIVWYHGGGFFAGSGNAASYDGRNLAEKHDVVLVTVTHRLNVFGFAYIAEVFGDDFADSGNVGVLDCLAALRWVRQNIAEFGGDPANVTIAGQSGGGAKVTTLMAMPAARGLFRRAIVQSGAALKAIEPTVAAAGAHRWLAALESPTLAQLQALPAARLLAAADSAALPYGPVVDGRTLTRHPFDPDAPPSARDVPLLIGVTETEATFLPTTPLDPMDDARLHELAKAAVPAPDAAVDRLLMAFRHAHPGKDNTYLYQLLASQLGLFGATLTEADRKADQGGAPVYAYYFRKHTGVRGGKLRAPHTLEIPYALDSLAHASPIIGPVTPAQQALADRVSSSWVSFARRGDPNHADLPHWGPFDTRRRATMVLDDVCELVDDPLRETRLALAEALRATAIAPAS